MPRNIYIIFGPPGSGKGTQAEMISEKFKIPTISVGNLLRHEEEGKSKLAKQLRKILSAGKLVKEKTVDHILSARLKKKDVKKGFVLDGYPRNVSQFHHLFKEINKKKDDKIIFIFIKTSDKEIKERLGKRRACECGETYHLKFKKPKKAGRCDACGKKLYIREDDKPEIIKNRIKLYHESTQPIIALAKKTGHEIIVDGDKDIKEVSKEMFKKIKEISSPLRKGRSGGV